MTTVSIVVKARRPGEPGLLAELRELWTYRHLIKTLVGRDLRVRYKNSVIGIAWTMVNPLIQVFVLTIAVGYILSAGPPSLSAYIFCATLPWTFFSSAILDSSTSVLTKLGLLKKIYFPREIPLIATVCQNFFQFVITLGVFIVYRFGILSLLHHKWVGWPPLEILWLPVIVFMLFMLTLGAAFFISAANVFYEDVKFMVNIGMSFLFYLVPIMYWAENIRYATRIGSWNVRWWVYHLYLGNPLAWIITAFKQMFFARGVISSRGAPVVVWSAPFDYRYFAIHFVLCLLFCIAGYHFFNSRKWKFTERP